MSADVIQFIPRAADKKQPPGDEPSKCARYRANRIAKNQARIAEAESPTTFITKTCRNHRMRQGRRDSWNEARQLTDYWRARMKWFSALSLAQQYGVADSKTYADCKDYREHHRLVDLWRAALVAQMLTPAPDLSAVAWKRLQLRGGSIATPTPRPNSLSR